MHLPEVTRKYQSTFTRIYYPKESFTIQSWNQNGMNLEKHIFHVWSQICCHPWSHFKFCHTCVVHKNCHRNSIKPSNIPIWLLNIKLIGRLHMWQTRLMLRENNRLSAEMFLTPHCFHLCRNSGSLRDFSMPDAGGTAVLLHLLAGKKEKIVS